MTKKFLRHTRHYVNRPLRHPHSPFVPTALQLCYKTDGIHTMFGETSRDVSCIHFFGFKMFSIFFTMNLAVKIFRIFFTMNLAVKIFRIFFTMNLAVKFFDFFYNEFGCKNFSNFFYNEFGCKNFSNFLYSRINFFFFVVKNEKSSHVSQTPYLVSMLFSRPRWSFFQGVPNILGIPFKIFRAYLVSWKRFEAIWDHMFLWSLCDDTWKSCFAQIFMKNLTVKKIRTFFTLNLAVKFFEVFFYIEFNSKIFFKIFWGKIHKTLMFSW